MTTDVDRLRRDAEAKAATAAPALAAARQAQQALEQAEAERQAEQRRRANQFDQHLVATYSQPDLQAHMNNQVRDALRRAAASLREQPWFQAFAEAEAHRQAAYLYSNRASNIEGREPPGPYGRKVREIDPFRSTPWERMIGDFLAQLRGQIVGDFEDQLEQARDAFIAGDLDELPAPPWVER